MKEERLAILRMLENGVISAEEAERLLNVLNENSEKDVSGNIESAFAKAGSALESIVGNVGKKAGMAAKVVGEKAEQAKPEIKKAATAVAEKVNEAAETIKQDFNKKKAEKYGVNESDFVYEGETKEKPVEDPAEETKSEDIAANSAEESSGAESEAAEPIDFSQLEDDKTNEEEDDDRDYEAEFFQMMKETNGGDIFGDVYKAMDNLKGIDSNDGGSVDNTDDVKTDKE